MSAIVQSQEWRALFSSPAGAGGFRIYASVRVPDDVVMVNARHRGCVVAHALSGQRVTRAKVRAVALAVVEGIGNGASLVSLTRVREAAPAAAGRGR